MIDTQEKWISTFRAANVLVLLLQNKIDIECVKNGDYFATNNAGNVRFKIGDDIFEVFCDVGSFDYIDCVEFADGEKLECDSPFPDDVIKHVLGQESHEKLVKIFLFSAK